jgi:hypothetical protein
MFKIIYNNNNNNLNNNSNKHRNKLNNMYCSKKINNKYKINSFYYNSSNKLILKAL